MKHISLLLTLIGFSLFGQSLQHPHIWTSSLEKATVLNKITTDTNEKWSRKLYDDLHQSIDSIVTIHESNPAFYLKNLPELDQKINSRNDHSKALYDAVQAGMLYFLDGDKKYAQFSADILSHYTLKISAETGDLWFSKTGRWIESRDLYPKVGMCYDFIEPFLKDSTNSVFNNSTGNRALFHHENAQVAFKKLADEVLYKGYVGSNHSVLEASGALFNLLCIENDSVRGEYFNLFMNGVPNTQDGFHTILQTVKDNNYLWPESASYGKETHEVVLHLLNVVDRYDPSLNLINMHRNVLKGAFLYENLRYPNQDAMIRFGDSRRVKHAHFDNLYLRVLAIGQRRGMNIYKKLAIKRIQEVYNLNQHFSPTIENEGLEWSNPTQLFWGIDVDLESNVQKHSFDASAQFTHAGVGVLRNYSSSEPKTYGLMGYIGGAHYVHSHLTGIEMELYGAGIVMGAGSGDPKSTSARSSDVYRNYHRIYAGHNTVIVNGDSKGMHTGSWKWDNIMYQNTSEIIAIEPTVNMDQTNSDGPGIKVADNFSFVTVELDDQVNDALQQRTFSIIRTSSTTGYYLDIFRSKADKINNFHDYVYHNYGEEFTLNSGGISATKGIGLTDQTRYTGDINTVASQTKKDTAYINFPGWQYFTHLNSSDETSNPISGKFYVGKINAAMHIQIPGGINRDYTACVAPPILETESDYKAEQSDSSQNDSAQVLLIRQYGEAWDRPFIVAFEPSKSDATVNSVTNLNVNSRVVGAKITSIVKGVTIIDFVISHDDDIQTFNLPDEEIEFTGRFGIVRKYKNVSNEDSLVELYIGDGISMLVNGQKLVPKIGTSAYSNISNFTVSVKTVEKEIAVYPNPSNTGLFYLTESQEFQVYNMSGKLLLEGAGAKIDLRTAFSGGFILKTAKGETTLVKN